MAAAGSRENLHTGGDPVLAHKSNREAVSRALAEIAGCFGLSFAGGLPRGVAESCAEGRSCGAARIELI